MGYETIDGLLASMRDGDITSPVSSHLGMRLTGFDRGRATYEMTVGDNLTNAMGVLQGGIASVLADATMAAASMTILDDEEIKREAVTTAQLNSSFLKAVKAGTTLRAEAEVVRSGRQLIWLECEVTAEGKAVGKFDALGIRVAFDIGDASTSSGAS
jgi:acyl-coenzyme A thioesterase 13